MSAKETTQYNRVNLNDNWIASDSASECSDVEPVTGFQRAASTPGTSELTKWARERSASPLESADEMPIKGTKGGQYYARMREFPDDDPIPNEVQMNIIRLLPCLLVISWFTLIIGLLGYWLFWDKVELYPWTIGGMPFFSHVGAQHPAFFTACVMVSVFSLILTIAAERWLRSRRVLVEATKERALWISIGFFDILVAIFAGVSLIVASTFNVYEHSGLHDTAMVCFFVGIALSALLQTLEVSWLWHEHPDQEDLHEGTILKSIFYGLAIVCMAIFWGLSVGCSHNATSSSQCYKMITASALMEWIACILIGFYFFTLLLDLYPSYRHSPVLDPAIADGHSIVAFRHPDTNQLIPAHKVQPIVSTIPTLRSLPVSSDLYRVQERGLRRLFSEGKRQSSRKTNEMYHSLAHQSSKSRGKRRMVYDEENV